MICTTCHKVAGRPKRNRQHGFTLVELLLVMVITSVLALMLTNFIASWLQASEVAQTRSNLLTDAETALDTITNDVMVSGSVDVNNRWPDPYSPSAPSNEYSWASGSQTLILAKIATDSSNNVIFSDSSKYITQKDNEVYYLTGTTLYRRTLASNSSNDAAITTCPTAHATQSCPTDETVATNVSNLLFTYYDINGASTSVADARAVQISITISQQQDGKIISASYTTRMVFRNE